MTQRFDRASQVASLALTAALHRLNPLEESLGIRKFVQDLGTSDMACGTKGLVSTAAGTLTAGSDAEPDDAS